jgi:LuxR family maltose regulon positive regulatory protein
MLAQKKPDDALKLLHHLREAAETGNRISSLIESWILIALAFHSLDKNEQALTAVEHALSLAKPGGFIRVFVNEGLPMARLLYEALSRNIAPDYTSRLLAAFPSDKTDQTAVHHTQTSQSELVEPLSKRELEVLQLVAKGLTNQEIAIKLYLSLNTVKVHTRNIYSKLGVRNRTQAVTKGRALGIIVPQ